MSGKKLFTVFIEAIHQELLAWTPKPRFVFKDFWPALGTKGVEQVVQTKHLEKEKEEFAEKEGVENVPEKEKEEHLVSWEKDGSISVAYPDAMHIFKLESGLIHYSKWTASAATDEKDFFDTEILEAEIGIRWDLKQKKKDKEEKEEDKEDGVENDVKKLISHWIKLGTKKTAADLRKLANDKQQLKKLLRELKKQEDALIEKVMKERKLEENKRKKEKKGKKGKKTTVPEAEVIVPEAEATVPEAEATVPEAETTVPEAEGTVPEK